MSPLRAAWNRFWFEPRRPWDLCAGRIAFYAMVAILYLPRDVVGWGTVDPVFWMPIDTFSFLRLPLFSPGVLAALEAAWAAALVLACIGLRTRLACWIAFLIGFYLLGLPQSMGKIHHFDGIVVTTLAILALSRCGDALSVDAWLRRRRGLPPAPERSAEYAWPVRLIQVALSLVFFAAGFAKVVVGGIDWIASDNFRWILIRTWHFGPDARPWTDLALFIVRHDSLVHTLAALTVVIELAYPLALFSRRLAAIMVPAGVLLLLGIRAIMGPAFGTLVACHVFWVPWEHVVERFFGRMPASSARP